MVRWYGDGATITLKKPLRTETPRLLLLFLSIKRFRTEQEGTINSPI